MAWGRYLMFGYLDPKRGSKQASLREAGVGTARDGCGAYTLGYSRLGCCEGT